MKFRLFFSLILSLWAFSPASAFFSFFKQEKMKTEEYHYDFSSAANFKDTLRIAYVSDLNLYPVPTSQEKFPEPPISKVGIMYKESQVIAQEAIRDILSVSEKSAVDFVLYGGSQVANNMHWELFQAINEDLTKLGIDYYTVLGSGEKQGPLAQVQNKSFYTLKTKGTTILVLDNSSSAVVPEFLPEEATEQYIWLERQLRELQASGEEFFIFSYYRLDPRSKAFIDSFVGLNLKLIAHSYDLEFNASREGSLLMVEDDSSDDRDQMGAIIDSHNFASVQSRSTVLLSNPAASVYPLSFTLIERDLTGNLTIKVVPISLDGVRRKAKP